MREIINYIRSCFCKHEWELLDESIAYKKSYITDAPYQIGKSWTYRCKKCGYFKTHKNYD